MGLMDVLPSSNINLPLHSRPFDRFHPKSLPNRFFKQELAYLLWLKPDWCPWKVNVGSMADVLHLFIYLQHNAFIDLFISSAWLCQYDVRIRRRRPFSETGKPINPKSWGKVPLHHIFRPFFFKILNIGILIKILKLPLT